MHKKRIILFTFICFTIMYLHAAAKDAPAPPQPGPANAEFQRVFEEWKTLVGELGALRAKYRTAQKDEQPEIKKQWDVLIEKGKAMKPKLFQAAEKAFAEAPNADKDITGFLLDTFDAQMEADDYENAARVGKLLVDNHCGATRTASDAGIAAVSIGDFDAAEKYLALANKEGYYKRPQPTDQRADLAKHYLSLFMQFKTAWDKEQKIRQAETLADDLPRVLIKTNKGDMVVELFENEAPNTVANFVSLVDKGFYNGVAFHRVLPGFMAQGGDPEGTGRGGPGYTIPFEANKLNHRLHFRGSLSMARQANGKDTAGSQFFICFAPKTELDGEYTVFGRVIDGFDVLAKIQRRDPDKPDQPVPDKIIEAKVLRKRPHEYTVKKVQ